MNENNKCFENKKITLKDSCSNQVDGPRSRGDDNNINKSSEKLQYDLSLEYSDNSESCLKYTRKGK